MKSKVESVIERALKQYSENERLSIPESFAFEVVVSKDSTHGDFASNVALKLAGVAKSKPRDVAAGIATLIQQTGEIERVEIAGPGFLNFYLANESLAQVLLEILKRDHDFGKSQQGQKKKVLLEFVSANPTGPLTIAHGRQAIVGDALARILQATGHKVQKEYYLNDGGRQITLLGESLWARYQETLGMEFKLPEEGYQGAYLKDVAAALIDKHKDTLIKMEEDEALTLCRQFACDFILGGIREDLSEVGVQFDSYFREGDLYRKDAVKETMAVLKEKGHLFEEGGALWFRSTDLGDDKDRVVKKSTGEAI